MQFNRLWIATLLLSTSGVTHAAYECHFSSNDPRQIMSPGVQPVITPLPPGTITAPTLISTTILMEMTPTLTSGCEAGNDGDNFYSLTDNTLRWGNVDDKATFRTNIPGIYYTIALYPGNNRLTAWFPPNAGEWYVTGNIHEDEGIVKDQTWHARMEIYQYPDFTGIPSGTQFLTAIGGPLGQVSIGNPKTGTSSDHPRPLINISEMSFNIPLNEPTCALRAPTTVDLGDWFRSDLETDSTKEVPFQITGTCVNTKAVYATVTSANTTADKGYFTNVITGNAAVAAAGGVGVKLSSPASSHIFADGSKLTLAIGDNIGVDPVHFVDYTFNAKLVKTGSEPVTVGVFGTSVTFQVTYE
ncbi:fimbrial protein StkG [Salmonella enterica]|uniref:Fimbrial protein n=1 Tax=Salmonella enterica subsp. salamae TaxID=59202 RepID=A0A6D2GF82_SALER|nr:fimbrial protein StkG [Salmonella enterica]ECJ2423775.1 fimbrial protein StkG [Salmonella enterica subsp. salamae]EEP8431519.1 fimbrial protein StkG [Salmonella enterica subsp. salamae]KAA8685219.1 fimbrial protein StkG [Salmonella enterica subsp. salamae]VEA06179.1 fimbrial protein [Salmonella enterica subsp. salamae]HAU3054112.1 fimbrial protein StkG [Salmonella enterica subsp. salamae]